jgi:GntR family transcriptional regulator, arabinose operon transcriptional repressor
MISSLESNGGPKYRQVLDTLRSEILSGRYQPGEKLPSEIDLVKRFGTSRITIGRAVRELGDMDLIERRRGSGTYVREVKSSGLTFGLLIPNLGQTEIFEPICRGMMDAGGQHALLWGNASEGDARSGEALQLCNQYVERRVSGVFFAPLEFSRDNESVNQRVIALLEKARIPVVLLDRCYLPYPQRSHHDLVGIDNRLAGYLATEHLLKLGCRRIAFLSQVNAASTVGARISGYREALLHHDVSLDVGLIQNFDASDRNAVARFLKEQDPEAIVCVNDRVAANLMHSLIDISRKIPKDVRIVGIDDVGYARLLPVPLTTVHQPCREIGITAMETMLSRLENPRMPTRDVLLATRLVVRKSCGTV